MGVFFRWLARRLARPILFTKLAGMQTIPPPQRPRPPVRPWVGVPRFSTWHMPLIFQSRRASMCRTLVSTVFRNLAPLHWPHWVLLACRHFIVGENELPLLANPI